MSDQRRWAILREVVFYALGVLLIAGFVYLYWTRFSSPFRPAMPQTIQNLYLRGPTWAIAVNAAVFLLFIAFFPYRGKVEWRSKGAFAAFILALFTEMFGIPLLAFILSPLIGDLPTIKLPHLPPIDLLNNPHFFGWAGMVLGAWLTLAGMILVLVGWVQIHHATGLVTTGLYRYVRHPQYLGLFLILTGWILHWPTLLTLLMYPILLMMYYRLARREETELTRRFDAEYEAYRRATPMFLPLAHPSG